MRSNSFDLPSLALNNAKQNSKRTRPKTIILRPIDPSPAIELDFLTALNQLVRAILRNAREYVAPVAVQEGKRFQRDDVGQNARSIIEALRSEASRAEATASVAGQSAIGAEGSRHTKKWTATVASQAQIDVRYLLRDDDLVDLLSIRSEEFNRLIKNLSNDVLDRIERQTLGSIFEGRGQSDIAKSLQEIEGIGRNRARLIARDQASKLNGAMNELRQRQAGIRFYKWRTILDGRERPSHHANNGKIFSWDKPPPTGAPSTAVNCRCRGLAVISDDPADVGDTPIPAELEEIGVEANELLFQRVASTPTQNVFNWTTPNLATRQEELSSVKEIVAKYRAASEFTERDAEHLATIIYGSLPTDDILAGLYGSRAMSAFVRRRTLLLHAINERLDLVERLLTQAVATRGGGE